MKRQASYGFNKEKLVLLVAALLLAGSAYNFFASQPVALEVTTPVTPLPIPSPLTPDKLDTRMANVIPYLETGKFGDVAVNRDRKNPFEPIDDFVSVPQSAKVNTEGVKTPAAIAPPTVVAPSPELQPLAKKDDEDPNKFGPKDDKAKVDFSAVVRMNGITYGLLKDKDGKTVQVKVGDYMEDFKYTVSKIEKQAIWVTDEKDHVFVARDLSFADDGSGGGDTGDEEKPVKKKPLAKAAKPVAAPVPTAPKATPPKQNNNNNNTNDNNRRRRGGNNNGNNNNNNMNVINNNGY